jgi:hypothetical protein
LFSQDNKLVFSLEGRSDFEEYQPVANADILNSDKAEETPADTARRERSVSVLEEKGIPYFLHLRAAVFESEAVFRSPIEITERLYAIFAVCTYSEARSCKETWDEAQKYIEKVDDILGGKLQNILSYEEKAYLDSKEPDQHELAKFGWRYECCYVLMWALGVEGELGYPDQICDVSKLAKKLWGQNSLEDFVKITKPRSKEEVLDAADLVLRYDWACVDARIKGQESPAGLNSEVVVEWHYAFNWLISANDGADWDGISTDT